MMADVEKQVYACLAKCAERPIQSISNNLLLYDLEFDSLEYMGLAQVLDDTFGITTSTETIERLKTVGELVEYIEILIEKNAEETYAGK